MTCFPARPGAVLAGDGVRHPVHTVAVPRSLQVLALEKAEAMRC